MISCNYGKSYYQIADGAYWPKENRRESRSRCLFLGYHYRSHNQETFHPPSLLHYVCFCVGCGPLHPEQTTGVVYMTGQVTQMNLDKKMTSSGRGLSKMKSMVMLGF